MRVLFVLASILCASACNVGDDDCTTIIEVQGKNIVELAQSQPDLSTLVAALSAGGLTGTLSGKGPFTVFAPTNEAFAKIQPTALQALLQNKAMLDKVLEYHVIAADFRMKELMAVKVAKTLEGDTVKVDDPENKIVVNQAKVLTADVKAANGYVHIIDSVLMPPSLPPLPLKVNIVQTAQRTADLSTLVAALSAGKLVDALEGKGPFTVFAPTNEAFAKIPQGTLTALLKNTKLLDQLLEYHVLSGAFTARDLMATKVVSTLEKEQLVVRNMNGVMVNNAKVVTADVGATNGFVHIIDHVLVPPGFPETVYPMNIVELAESQPDLATLVTAVVAGKLAPTLSSNNQFTVFAPTNEAFAKIPKATLQKLLADTAALDKVLEYHVLPGHFTMRDLMSVEKAKTLEGAAVTVMSNNGIKVNNANVLKADIAASNGVVHVIDSVLMPPTEPSKKNIVQLAQSQRELSTLVTALTAADLTGFLSQTKAYIGGGPFTVLAPTNEAFAKIGKEALQALLKDKELLRKVLEYHVIRGKFTIEDLARARTARTVENGFVDVSKRGILSDHFEVNKQSVVLTADVEASNGIVHIIDSVLTLPALSATGSEKAGDSTVVV